MRKILLTSSLFFTALFSDLPTAYPPALQKGDLIAIVFPAAFLDKDYVFWSQVNAKMVE